MTTRYPLLALIAAALLAGCGAATPNVARIQSVRAERGPGQDLLYVSVAGNYVDVFTYPSGESVGTLTGFDNPTTMCSDQSGNVWIVNAGSSSGDAYLVEYAHGGTSPVAMLYDSNNSPQGCSVDPGTGNLAVANSNGNAAVYKDAEGKAKIYSTEPYVAHPTTVMYDDSGNLYIASGTYQSAWLPKGASGVEKFSLAPSAKTHGPFVWDGQYLTTVNFSKKAGAERVIRYDLRGDRGKRAGFVLLDTLSSEGQYAIQGSDLAIAERSAGAVYLFSYPDGGEPVHSITGLSDPTGIAVSQ